LTIVVSIADWLATPQQKLLAVTSGKVFYDGLGTLTQVCVFLYNNNM